MQYANTNQATCGCSFQLTLCLAGLRDGIHLVTFIAFTFKVSLVVDADLAAGVRVLTLIDVCRETMEEGSSIHGQAQGQRCS